MNFWKVILATIAIFAMGMVTGGFIAKRQSPAFVENKPVAPEGTNRFRADSRHMREFMKKVHDELGLTEEQRANVEQIVRDSQTRSRKIWEEFAPRMHEEFKAAQEQICDQLTPEQRERFKELMKQRHPPKSENGSDRDRQTDKPDNDQPTAEQHPQANDCQPCPPAPRCRV